MVNEETRGRQKRTRESVGIPTEGRGGSRCNIVVVIIASGTHNYYPPVMSDTAVCFFRIRSQRSPHCRKCNNVIISGLRSD